MSFSAHFGKPPQTFKKFLFAFLGALKPSASHLQSPVSAAALSPTSGVKRYKTTLNFYTLA